MHGVISLPDATSYDKIVYILFNISESVYPEKDTGSGYSGHGGPLNQWGQHMGGGGGQMHGHTGGGQIQGQMGGGQMSGFMGGLMGGPSGDPTKQQQHMQQSMTSSGSCVPSHSECPCPNHKFYAPSNCYFCDCNGYQGQGKTKYNSKT